MNIDECWQMITDCTLREDWYGLLVAADGLSDAGDDDTAVAIRWAIGRRWFPVNNGDKLPYHKKMMFRLWILEGSGAEIGKFDVSNEGVRLGWKWVASIRKQLIERTEVLEYIR